MKTSKHIGPRMHFPHKLYILMRNDIPSMNAGKAMAQAAHAANQFVYDHGNNVFVKEDWAEKGKAFGTTIVLSVTGEELYEVFRKADAHKNVMWGEVVDESYPFITDTEIAKLIPQDKQTKAPIFKDDGRVVMFREEITCGYLFVVDGSSLQEELVGALPLHP